MKYIPENVCEITANINAEFLKNAMENKVLICAKVLLYRPEEGLILNLGGFRAIIPKDMAEYSQTGHPIKEAALITKVNKKVCFYITDIKEENGQITVYCSRRDVQKQVFDEYISNLKPGDVIPCTVTHIDSFGVFCDVAAGITALLPIDFISTSRIAAPSERFTVGQNIFACVKSIDENERIVLTHKELLGTWQENADLYAPFSTATGIVRSIENYGIFIELTPNLAGLAEVCEGVSPGDRVNVYIKSIIPDKMKIKLVILSKIPDSDFKSEINYRINSGHIRKWKYSPDNAKKQIETVF